MVLSLSLSLSLSLYRKLKRNECVMRDRGARERAIRRGKLVSRRHRKHDHRIYDGTCCKSFRARGGTLRLILGLNSRPLLVVYLCVRARAHSSRSILPERSSPERFQPPFLLSSLSLSLSFFSYDRKCASNAAERNQSGPSLISRPRAESHGPREAHSSQ